MPNKFFTNLLLKLAKKPQAIQEAFLRDYSPPGLDWALIRGLGQLHVLNRTSIFILVLVPFLASLWPVVQHTLMWYDGLLGNIEERLEDLTTRLDQPIAPSALSSIGGSEEISTMGDNLKSELKQLGEELDELRVRSAARLPEVWGLLFFASLAVLIGRTIFQLRCPEVVRDFPATYYIREKRREYAEAPSVSALHDAMEFLQARRIRLDLIQEVRETEEAAEAELRNLKEKLFAAEKGPAIADLMASELETFKEQQFDLEEKFRDEVAPSAQKNILDQMEANKKEQDDLTAQIRQYRDLVRQIPGLRDEVRRQTERDRGDHGPDFRRKMALIELSAQYHYAEAKEKFRISMLICALAYLIAITMIFQVFWDQGIEVATKVGWLRNAN